LSASSTDGSPTLAGIHARLWRVRPERTATLDIADDHPGSFTTSPSRSDLAQPLQQGGLLGVDLVEGTDEHCIERGAAAMTTVDRPISFRCRFL
jgi:hypothetical protein